MRVEEERRDQGQQIKCDRCNIWINGPIWLINMCTLVVEVQLF